MLGENIYNLRKEKKLSQEQLAEQIGVSRQTISNWELGETSPNPEQLKLLSKTLNTSIDELLNNDVNTVLVEKVSNTEKLAGITIKILKVLGIIFIILLIIDILSLILFSALKANTMTHQSTEVSINCIKEKNSYLITVSDNGKYNCSNCSEEMTQEIEKIVNYSDLDITVRNIENYFENKNGTCE